LREEGELARVVDLKRIHGGNGIHHNGAVGASPEVPTIS